MTTIGWVLLGAAAVAAVADWFAVARSWRTVEYVAKPTAIALLLVLAVVLDARLEAQRWLVAVALLCSLVGDVLLMLPRERTVGGLLAFLGAHVAYIAAFLSGGLNPAALGVGILIAGGLGITIAVGILSSIAQSRLRVGVAAYVVVIVAMLATAIATENPFAATGAALFVASDTVLGWNRFVGGLAWAPVTIMVTYHAAQALLVISLTHG
jgi:uncharacterized membrane protein YhhN